MIDKITIELDDSGKMVITGGLVVITDSLIDAFKTIKSFIPELAYFTKDREEIALQKKPISYMQFEYERKELKTKKQ